MAEKEERPLQISSTPPPINDQESATSASSAKLRRKRRVRLCVIFIATVVVIVLISTTIDLTILRVRTPKYRIDALTVDRLIVSNSTNSSPSFSVQFDAKITIKNKNFGPYDYYNSDAVYFLYGGTNVGWGLLERGLVKMRSTKRLELKLNVSSTNGDVNDSNLRRDLDSGILRFSAEGEKRGQVEFIKFIKKDRIVKMSCNLAVNLGDKVVQDLVCD